MASTKATAVAEWAGAQGLAMTRFDYSAHGRSSGTLLEATIGDWLEETIAVWDADGAGAAHRHRLVHGRLDRAPAWRVISRRKEEAPTSPASS